MEYRYWTRCPCPICSALRKKKEEESMCAKETVTTECEEVKKLRTEVTHVRSLLDASREVRKAIAEEAEALQQDKREVYSQLHRDKVENSRLRNQISLLEIRLRDLRTAPQVDVSSLEERINNLQRANGILHKDVFNLATEKNSAIDKVEKYKKAMEGGIKYLQGLYGPLIDEPS